MSKIKILPESIYSRIAAGEVVERPESIVKELVENSIDARATAISVEIEEGGIKRIRITDNGMGIPADELRLAVTKHATSKITTIEDLNSLYTMGFRGEALASIGAVSSLKLRSRVKGAESGAEIAVRGGVVLNEKPVGCPEGTTVIVDNLFFNIPARLKFLKVQSKEAARVTNVIVRLALANPKVSFKYTSGSELLLHTSGNGRLLDAIGAVYGFEQKRRVTEVDTKIGDVRVYGYIGLPAFVYKTTRNQTALVNGRYVRSELIQKAVQKGYGERILKGEHPFFVLNVEVPFSDTDVNVHPNKLTIRFRDEQKIEYIVINAVSAALAAAKPTPAVTLSAEPKKRTREVKETSVLDEVLSAIPDNEAAPVTQSPSRPANSGTPATDTLDELKSMFSDAFERKAPPLAQNPVYTLEPKRSAAVSVEEMAKVPVKKAQKTVSQSTAPLRTNQEQKPLPGYDEKPADLTLPFLNELKAPCIIHGAAFNTYILAEKGDTLYIIDQHAAHERLMYDRLMSDALSKEPIVQPLLIPEDMTVSHDEELLLRENLELIGELGIGIELTERLRLRVSAIPVIMRDVNVRTLINELLAALEEGGDVVLRRERIIKASCRSAVKAGQRLEPGKIEEIVDQLDKLQTIPNCPHGRPIAIALTKKELEKSFKRTI